MQEYPILGFGGHLQTLAELWPFLFPDEVEGMFFGASINTFCPSGPISQDLLVRFDTSLR